MTFLLIAECLELLCSFVHVPEWLYRVLAIRYVFLIYLGFIWVKEGIAINVKNVMLCVISAIAAVFFVCSSNEHEPWFFNTAWSYSRWPCYFWVSNGLVMLLWYLWEFLKKSQMVVSAVNVLAKTTWEIYLMQMASIYILNKDMISVDNKVLHYFLYASIICTISIGGGILLNKLFAKFIYNYSHVQKHN